VFLGVASRISAANQLATDARIGAALAQKQNHLLDNDIFCKTWKPRAPSPLTDVQQFAPASPRATAHELERSRHRWRRLEPLIPAAKSGGRPRKTDMRAAMNAILYLLRTAVPGGICRAVRFLHARRSTKSSASSSATACGSASGKRASYGAAQSARPGGQPDCRDHRQPVAQKGAPRPGAKRTQWVTTPARRFGRNRRLAKDYETLAGHPRRLRHPLGDPVRSQAARPSVGF
jgi:hypothetical protein